jgi:prophage regulatory protein
MHDLPSTGFLRERDIINTRPTKDAPSKPGIIPVCASVWWRGIRAGRYPKPVRAFGSRVAVWRVEDIRELIKRLGDEGAA